MATKFLVLVIVSTCFASSVHQSLKILAKYADFDIDPCDDFYAFVCGNKKEPEKRINVAEQMKELLKTPYEEDAPETVKAKVLFQKCMDEEEIEKENILAETKILSGSERNLTELTIQSFKATHSPLWLSFEGTVEKKTEYEKRKVIRISFPSTYVSFLSESDQESEYWKLLTKQLFYYTNDLLVPWQKLVTEMQEVYDFEVNYFTNSRSNMEKANETDYCEHNIISIDRLQRLFPLVNWTVVLDYYEVPFRNTQMCLMVTEKYLENLVSHISRTPERILKLYTLIHYVNHLHYQQTSDQWINIDNFLHATGLRPKGSHTRENDCFHLTIGIFPQIVGKLYVNEYVDPEDAKAAMEIFYSIKQQFQDLISSASWISQEAQLFFVRRLFQLDIHIGYRKLSFSDTEIVRLYHALKVEEDDSFWKIMERVDAMTHKITVEGAKWPNHDVQEFLIQKVGHSYYNLLMNYILIHPSLLHRPHFHRSWSTLEKYAFLGVLFAHEIGHLFDRESNGSYSSCNSNLVMTRIYVKSSLNDLQKFNRRAQCLVNQYSSHLELNATIDGERTLNENIADNIAIRATFNAYQLALEDEKSETSSKSNNQLFFFTYAYTFKYCNPQTHEEIQRHLTESRYAPHKARINIPFSNMREFSEVFDCPPSSKMNPDKKCKIF